jgi:hypothetical protein
MTELPKLEHLATPRSVKAAAWAVGITWFAAVFSATLAVVHGNWALALMSLAAAANAAGWWVATHRWVEWSTIAVGLLATLERAGVRYWLDEPPDGP